MTAYTVGVHGHPRGTKGLDVSEIVPRAIEARFDGVPTRVIGLDDLLTNKRASGRLQDLADLSALERLRRQGVA